MGSGRTLLPLHTFFSLRTVTIPPPQKNPFFMYSGTFFCLQLYQPNQIIKCDSRYKPKIGNAVFYVHDISAGRDTSVGIATHHGLHGLGIESRWTDLPHPSRPDLWPIESPLQWAQGLFLGVKRPRGGDDNTPPSSAEVKERVQLYL